MKLPVYNIAHEGTSHDIDVRKKTTLMTYMYAQYAMIYKFGFIFILETEDY